MAGSVCEYGVLTVPPGRDPADTEIGVSCEIRMLKFCVAFAFVAAELSVAWMVKLYDPCAVGVPEIAPVVADKDRPAGSAPALTLHV